MPIPVVERSEKEVAGKIRRRVQSLDEVAECREVTIGSSRKKPSIHFHVFLKGNPSFTETHKICVKIDRTVRSLVPNARVFMHSQSQQTGDPEDVWKLIKRIADGEPGTRGVQNIHIRNDDGKLDVDFQIHLTGRLTSKELNELQTRVSNKLRASNARISEVVVHQQTVLRLLHSEQEGHGTELRAYLEHVARGFPEVSWIGPLAARRASDGLHLVDRIALAPGTTDERASEIKAGLGAAIRDGYSASVKADIIVEPRTLGET